MLDIVALRFDNLQFGLISRAVQTILNLMSLPTCTFTSACIYHTLSVRSTILSRGSAPVSLSPSPSEHQYVSFPCNPSPFPVPHVRHRPRRSLLGQIPC